MPDLSKNSKLRLSPFLIRNLGSFLSILLPSTMNSSRLILLKLFTFAPRSHRNFWPIFGEVLIHSFPGGILVCGCAKLGLNKDFWRIGELPVGLLRGRETSRRFLGLRESSDFRDRN